MKLNIITPCRYYGRHKPKYYRYLQKNDCNKLRGRPPQYAPAPCKLTFDLLTLKVVSESRVTWATSVPILVFLGLSVLDLDPMYARDRQTSDVKRASSLNALCLRPMGAGLNKANVQLLRRSKISRYIGVCANDR